MTEINLVIEIMANKIINKFIYLYEKDYYYRKQRY